MNPFEQKVHDARLKRLEWTETNDGTGNPSRYIREEMEALRDLEAWDENRAFVIRCTNNPWITEIEVPVSYDVKFVLHPRVKLSYEFISIPPYRYEDPAELRDVIASVFASPHYSVKPVYVDKMDIQSTMLSLKGRFRDKGTPKHLANVNIFFRDLSFIDSPPDRVSERDLYAKIVMARRFLLKQKSAWFSLYVFDHKFEMKVTVPHSEDAELLLSEFAAANPGYMEHTTPVIILHNLASNLFFQRSSCKRRDELLTNFFLYFGRDELLTNFFLYFGPVSNVNISKDEVNGEVSSVSVQYLFHDDFHTALRTLCCCSLRQDPSPLLLDYEVGLGTIANDLH